MLWQHFGIFSIQEWFHFFWDRWREYQTKIELSYDQSDPGCNRQSPAYDHSNGVIVKQYFAKYQRVKVEARGVNSIENCSGWILSITKDSISKTNGETLQLPFAPSWSPDAKEKKLQDKVSYYLDVIRFNEDDTIALCDQWENTYKRPSSVDFETMFAEYGTYEIKVAVSGNDVPTSISTLILDWQGDCKTAKIVAK